MPVTAGHDRIVRTLEDIMIDTRIVAAAVVGGLLALGGVGAGAFILEAETRDKK